MQSRGAVHPSPNQSGKIVFVHHWLVSRQYIRAKTSDPFLRLKDIANFSEKWIAIYLNPVKFRQLVKKQGAQNLHPAESHEKKFGENQDPPAEKLSYWRIMTLFIKKNYNSFIWTNTFWSYSGCLIILPSPAVFLSPCSLLQSLLGEVK